MANDSEIEMKLTISPGDAVAFRRHSLLRERVTGRPKRRSVYNVYFDTPELALKQRAMALRLRKAGGKWLQTLKNAGDATGGLHRRGEWEYPLRLAELDLALFRETPLAELADSKNLHLTLKPVFTTEFQRTTWLVEISPGQRVEVALDQGVIRCGDSELAISEVEIELLEGSAAAVFDVAGALASEIALRPAVLSKAERGYGLLQPAPMAPRRARAVELKRHYPPLQAMLAIFTACLDHFDANVEGAIVSDDPEYIHQLRVALRRLRSAMRIFRPAHAEHVAAELKWLAAALGTARDWDVLVTETLPVLLDAFGDPRLASELIARARQRQAASREVTRSALASTREALLVLAVGRWVCVTGELSLFPSRSTGDGGATPPPQRQHLPEFASHEIRRHHRRLLRVSGALADLPAEARHQVRIEAKRLRYAVDFFSSLFDKKSVSPYLKVLSRIQDLLGETNDNAVAMHLVKNLEAPERFGDFSRGWFTARSHIKLAGIDRHFATLKKTRRFWGKKTARKQVDDPSEKILNR